MTPEELKAIISKTGLSPEKFAAHVLKGKRTTGRVYQWLKDGLPEQLAPWIRECADKFKQQKEGENNGNN